MAFRRRRHGKSRRGCQTCKTRHVKCDELRPQCLCSRTCTLLNKTCIYLDDDGPESSRQRQVDLPTSSDIPLLAAEPTETETTIIPLYDASCINRHWPEIELRLYYAGTQLVSRMSRDNGHLLTVGTAELPTLHRMGLFADHVRYAMLALRSGYFAKYQKSLQLHLLHRFYKTMALNRLQHELSCFSQRNADSVLAASLLLWFGSEDGKEEEFFIQGTSTVIQAMQPWKKHSLLQTYLLEDFNDNSCYPSVRAVDLSNPDRIHEPLLFSRMLESVYNLYRYIRFDGGELKGMVKLFLHALHNLRAGNHTAVERAKVRTTLRLYRNIGRETLANIGSGSPRLMATVAHFELMQAYIMAQAGSSIGFSGANMRSVERISQVLIQKHEGIMSREECERNVDDLSDVLKCIELIKLPISVAADFRMRKRLVFLE